MQNKPFLGQQQIKVNAAKKKFLSCYSYGCYGSGVDLYQIVNSTAFFQHQ